MESINKKDIMDNLIITNMETVTKDFPLQLLMEAAISTPTSALNWPITCKFIHFITIKEYTDFLIITKNMPEQLSFFTQWILDTYPLLRNQTVNVLAALKDNMEWMMKILWTISFLKWWKNTHLKNELLWFLEKYT